MTSTQQLEMEIDLLEKKKTATESDLRYKARQYNDSMPCEPGMEDNDVAFLMMMSIERDRDRLDVEIAEKRLELYGIQAGEVPEVAAPPADSTTAQPTEPDTPSTKFKTERAWFHLPGKDGKGQFLALANAKGSCSLRRFQAGDGTALPKGENRPGDYRNGFAKEIEHATPVSVSHQPNLERDCKKRLPLPILQELQKQIVPATAEA